VARTKAELLQGLHDSLDELTAAGLDDLDLTVGVYEGGWNGHQLLAHLASIEWTYPKVLALPTATDEEAARPRDTSVTVDDYNRRQVEQRADRTVAELLDELRRNRARTIEAVHAHPEGDFDRRVRSAGGTVGTLADVLWFVAVDHVRGHIADLRGA
jgi:hypothetical protein